MKKNIILLISLLFFILNCGYTAMYSVDKNSNFKISSIKIEGDREINNYISADLKRYTRLDHKKDYSIEINTIFEKNSLTKNKQGNTTDFELIANTTVKVIENIKSNNNINDPSTKEYNFSMTEKSNIKKNDDKFEEINYDMITKKNFAKSISDKIVFNLVKISRDK